MGVNRFCQCVLIANYHNQLSDYDRMCSTYKMVTVQLDFQYVSTQIVIFYHRKNKDGHFVSFNFHSFFRGLLRLPLLCQSLDYATPSAGKSCMTLLTMAPCHWFQQWSGQKPRHRGDEYHSMKMRLAEHMVERAIKEFPQLQDKVQAHISPERHVHLFEAFFNPFTLWDK